VREGKGSGRERDKDGNWEGKWRKGGAGVSGGRQRS